VDELLEQTKQLNTPQHLTNGGRFVTLMHRIYAPLTLKYLTNHVAYILPQNLCMNADAMDVQIKINELPRWSDEIDEDNEEFEDDEENDFTAVGSVSEGNVYPVNHEINDKLVIWSVSLRLQICLSKFLLTCVAISRSVILFVCLFVCLILAS
jgi:hypothetical protein